MITNKKNSLSSIINKEIGRRVLFSSTVFMIIIVGLTIYDLSISINQLRQRINEKIKPIEAFVMNQAMINNLDTVELKIENFNERNSIFQIEWKRHGEPIYNEITWCFPFYWVYDYPIENIVGFQFGYFKLKGSFLLDRALIYDLLFRLVLLGIFSFSVLCILYPLAKKIPEQLFVNPINRFIDLVLNNTDQKNYAIQYFSTELKMLEEKILALLKTATEHERNKSTIELGHLLARLAHDIHSPLVAMEMSLNFLTGKISRTELQIFRNGVQSIRDISSNMLERYRYSDIPRNFQSSYEQNNLIRPILLHTLVDLIASQKKREWYYQPCKLILIVDPETAMSWVNGVPNDIKRVLSNILNNAYDAILEKKFGLIEIFIERFHDELHLEVKDNGIGIPFEKIDDVLNGKSLKHIGGGLGLSVAKKCMENFGGRLEINSILGRKTNIKLIFPCTKCPPWFRSKIYLHNINYAVILDDDISMLTYWEQRMNAVGLSVKLFLDYHKALKWVEANSSLVSSTIFFADYALSENTNGLLFLERIKNSKNRYLITNYADEVYCQSAAKKFGIWLIPKSLIGKLDLISVA